MYWLLSLSTLYKPFISTRVEEFQDTHPSWMNEILYVPSDMNPADYLTKPVSVDKLLPWLRGECCNYLELDEKFWPDKFELERVDVNSIKPMLEEKPEKKPKGPKVKGKKKNTPPRNTESGNICSIKSVTDTPTNCFDLEIVDRFSSWPQLIRSVAFLKRCFASITFNGILLSTPDQLQDAEEKIMFICQRTFRENMNYTKKRFLKYCPFINDHGVVRAEGRLQNTALSDDMKNPIILPGELPTCIIMHILTL